MDFRFKKTFSSLTLTLLTSMSAFAQDGLNNFKIPVQQAVTHNKSLINANLENQKVALDRENVKGKLLPTVSANAMYGYLNSTLDIDLPAKTLPLLGTTIFDGTQKNEYVNPNWIGRRNCYPSDFLRIADHEWTKSAGAKI
jgi:outer membrane protein TolC